MNLTYLLRLLCLCFASFFLLNAALSLLASLLTGSAIRSVEKKKPKLAARYLLALRLLPSGLATLFVLGLCVPSYLWFEPARAAERVGLLCATLGLLGAATCSISLSRATRALLASTRHNRRGAVTSREIQIPGAPSALLVLEQETPLLAMSGLFRPHLLISRNLLHSLSPEELDAALRHEDAHRTSLDNAKRLLVLLAPDSFPFIHPLRLLERHWAKFAEWAADDQAIAANSARALPLAAALVRVARMGAAPRLPWLFTSFSACDRDLTARVDRLLNPVPILTSHPPQSHHSLRAINLLFAFAGASSLALTLQLLPVFSAVHNLLELFLH